jgi:hypothetical protein
MKRLVSLDIIALKQTLENFALTHSDANFRVSNYPAYFLKESTKKDRYLSGCHRTQMKSNL